MGPGNTPPERPLLYAYRYSGLGCVLAAAVIVFMAGGWLLDRWLNIVPVFTVIGALVGAALATFNIYMRLTEGERGKGKRGR